MSNRTLLSMAVLLTLLVSALVVDVRRGGADRGGPVFPGWENAPDSLRLVADGVTVVLRRDVEGTWSRDGRPLEEEASRTLDGLASGLASLDRGALVGTAVPPARLATFGLREASVSVGGRVGGGSRRLDLGRTSPLGGDVYACVTDALAANAKPDVFLLPLAIRSLVVDVTRRVSRAPDAHSVEAVDPESR